MILLLIFTSIKRIGVVTNDNKKNKTHKIAQTTKHRLKHKTLPSDLELMHSLIIYAKNPPIAKGIFIDITLPNKLKAKHTIFNHVELFTKPKYTAIKKNNIKV